MAYNEINFPLSVCAEKRFDGFVGRIYVRIPSSDDKCCVPIAIEFWIVPQFVRLKQWNSEIVTTRREKLEIHEMNAWCDVWLDRVQM